MDELRKWVLGRLDSGKTVVLAAVTRASGSTARGPDALLAMDSSGAMAGTVGGGYAEHETIDAVQQLFGPEGEAGRAGRIARDLEFDLTPETNNTQMICGGRLSVHLEKIEAEGEAARALRACFGRVEDGKPCAFVTVHTPRGRHCFAIEGENRVLFPTAPAGGERGLLAALLRALDLVRPEFRSAATFALEADDAPGLKDSSVFWLGLTPEPLVYIFGSGHVGKATCEVASLAGFRVVVTDDRPELLTPERFPHASLLRIIKSLEHPLAPCGKTPAIEIGPQDCALILTRKPDIDRGMLAELLRTEAGYVGLIGSKTKRDGIFASLRGEGYTDADLARVHSPVGLAIGARTPEEIAVSIVAEIIAVRAGVSPGKPYEQL
jgi:xanthine dehydrogenase accessory factor